MLNRIFGYIPLVVVMKFDGGVLALALSRVVSILNVGLADNLRPFLLSWVT
jgi:hypothetical protein